MNILYLTESREDYLQDQLLYGLRQLLGSQLVDYPRKTVMYGDASEDGLYGRGFTLWRLLDDIDVDRQHIERRVADGAFDRIIFGSIRRQKTLFWQWLRRGLLTGRSRGRFLFLDGQDGHRTYAAACLFGRYYKREYGRRTLSLVQPVSFSIPARKIRLTPPEKTQTFARHVQCEEAYQLPEVQARCGRGYLFDREADYYDDLGRSRYGITMKKGGWDCMRHYEIAANYAVPAFYRLGHKSPRCAPHGLEDMVNAVAFDSARELAQKIAHIERENAYRELQQNALRWVRAHTCEAAALRLLDTPSRELTREGAV
ncbi:MAG: hypothetical protein AAGA23_08905 [Pseudomonadota bacterium]